MLCQSNAGYTISTSLNLVIGQSTNYLKYNDNSCINPDHPHSLTKCNLFSYFACHWYDWYRKYFSLESIALCNFQTYHKLSQHTSRSFLTVGFIYCSSPNLTYLIECKFLTLIRNWTKVSTHSVCEPLPIYIWLDHSRSFSLSPKDTTWLDRLD